MRNPARACSGCSAATIPFLPMTTGRQVGAPPPLCAKTSSPKVVIDMAMRNEVRIVRMPLYSTATAWAIVPLTYVVEVLLASVLGPLYYCQGWQLHISVGHDLFLVQWKHLHTSRVDRLPLLLRRAPGLRENERAPR